MADTPEGFDRRLTKCDQCGCRAEESKICSACRATLYCSRECQRSGWSLHKGECNALAVVFAKDTPFTIHKRKQRDLYLWMLTEVRSLLETLAFSALQLHQDFEARKNLLLVLLIERTDAPRGGRNMYKFRDGAVVSQDRVESGKISNGHLARFGGDDQAELIEQWFIGQRPNTVAGIYFVQLIDIDPDERCTVEEARRKHKESSRTVPIPVLRQDTLPEVAMFRELLQGPISEAVWKGALEDSLSGGSMPASTSLDLGAMRAAGKILDLPEEFTRSR